MGKTAKYIFLELIRLLRNNPITRFAIDQVNNLKKYIVGPPLLSFSPSEPEFYQELHTQMERDLESLNLIKYNNLIDSRCSELSQTSADAIASAIYSQIRETPLILRNIEDLICCICDHIKGENMNLSTDIVKVVAQSCMAYE
jgi:hypothetical protein